MNSSNRSLVFRILSYLGVLLALFFSGLVMQAGFGGENAVPAAVGLVLSCLITAGLMVAQKYYKAESMHVDTANDIAVQTLNELAKQKAKDQKVE